MTLDDSNLLNHKKPAIGNIKFATSFRTPTLAISVRQVRRRSCITKSVTPARPKTFLLGCFLLITLPNKSASVWFTVLSEIYPRVLFYELEIHSLSLYLTLSIDERVAVNHREELQLGIFLFWCCPRKGEELTLQIDIRPFG